MPKILLIGPLPPPLGGATVLFSQLVTELKSRQQVTLSVINTARSSPTALSSAFQFVKVLKQTLTQISQFDVVGFHASKKGALLFAPFIYGICKLTGKPWLFRGFGGYFHKWFQSLSWPTRWLITHTLLQADAILLETQASVSFFQTLNLNLPVHWYANSRSWQATDSAPPRLCASKFIFLGHVSRLKGIPELIKASRQLESVSIDVYGPLQDDFTEDQFYGNIHYKGILQPEQVADKLQEYDALILPSKLPTEGYPGAIIEAFLAGIPVIASAIGAIPEIVDASSGLLIPPGDSAALATAINQLQGDSHFYDQIKQGATAKAGLFCSSRWTDEYLRLSNLVIAQRRAP